MPRYINVKRDFRTLHEKKLVKLGEEIELERYPTPYEGAYLKLVDKEKKTEPKEESEGGEKDEISEREQEIQD